MPYILEGREKLDARPYDAEAPGELAYVQSQLWRRYVQNRYRFAAFAEFFGATILALAEIWWRVIRDYEATKRKENGDCF